MSNARSHGIDIHYEAEGSGPADALAQPWPGRVVQRMDLGGVG